MSRITGPRVRVLRKLGTGHGMQRKKLSEYALRLLEVDAVTLSATVLVNPDSTSVPFPHVVQRVIEFYSQRI